MADYFFLGGNYKEILSIQTCCITACKYDSFLLAFLLELIALTVLWHILWAIVLKMKNNYLVLFDPR